MDLQEVRGRLRQATDRQVVGGERLDRRKRFLFPEEPAVCREAL